jgi:hypothetical protein
LRRLAKFFRRFNFGFSLLPKSLASHSLFQIQAFTFSYRLTTTAWLAFAARRLRGRSLLPVFVCKTEEILLDNLRDKIDTIDSPAAYIFGNVDKIGTSAASLSA